MGGAEKGHSRTFRAGVAMLLAVSEACEENDTIIMIDFELLLDHLDFSLRDRSPQYMHRSGRGIVHVTLYW
jgi:hypothetical protein